MSTVIVRRFAASPARTAAETWNEIVQVLASSNSDVKIELNKVTDPVACIIAECYPNTSPITIIGSGPRLRIYCLYDEDALSDDIKEDAINWNPFDTDWEIHFPVAKKDLDLFTDMMKKFGSRFKIYEIGEQILNEQSNNASMPQLTINLEKLKKDA